MRGEITEIVAMATLVGLLLSGGWMWLQAKLGDPDLLMLREEWGDWPAVPHGFEAAGEESQRRGWLDRAPTDRLYSRVTGHVARHDEAVDKSCRHR
jgi:hypothetical protein